MNNLKMFKWPLVFLIAPLPLYPFYLWFLHHNFSKIGSPASIEQLSNFIEYREILSNVAIVALYLVGVGGLLGGVRLSGWSVSRSLKALLLVTSVFMILYGPMGLIGLTVGVLALLLLPRASNSVSERKTG